MFLAPTNLVVAGLGCSVLSAGLACVVVLMLEFVTDTIDYGHWKLGQRHSATTFALQPLIHKVGAALGTQIVAITLILTGINQAATPSAVTAQGLLGLRLATLVLPAVLTLISLVVMLRKYSIDEQFHAQILGDLRARRQLVDEMDESRR
jgi:Na+/melibiose symporter-like transporter